MHLRRREKTTANQLSLNLDRLFGKATALLSALALGSLPPALSAAPTGGTVTNGTGGIAQSGATTTITQTTPALGLSWTGFNIGAAETVNFVQPSASAIAVNRIHDVNGTQILGRLNANGQVYLINPNGLLFGAGSQVNVGGLVASTLDLADADLASGRRTFQGTGSGSVINQGTLNAADGGSIALLGGTVGNQGIITARLGTVALGAGSQVTLDFAGDRLLTLTVDANTVTALAENHALIQADGGTVLLSAGAKDSLVASTLNNTGVIEAQTLENHDGRIVLLGGQTAGTTTVAGTLDASAPDGGDGGVIETSAAHVNVADSASITTLAATGATGTWLIDSQDLAVTASGGTITGAALSTQLASNNVTLQSADGTTSGHGDLFVNDAVSWSTNTTLTLVAERNIEFNAPLTATGATAGLVLDYGIYGYYHLNGNAPTLSGETPSLKMGSAGWLVTYTVINRLGEEGSLTGTDLQGILGDLAGNYALGADIDASATSGWHGGAGFVPIGFFFSSDWAFSGNFTGLGHTITGLTINAPTAENVGLFGVVADHGDVWDVGLVNAAIHGGSYVGGLVGLNLGNIVRVSSSGVVSGDSYVGGLVGRNYGKIIDAHFSGSVYGGSAVGGLVGNNNGDWWGTTGYNRFVENWFDGVIMIAIGPDGLGEITDAYATGSVSGDSRTGGLVGENWGVITNAYADASVSGRFATGGLVGDNGSGAINNAFAVGPVFGQYTTGGLVGSNYIGWISNVFAAGSVSGKEATGGLVGFNGGAYDGYDWGSGVIMNAYWGVATDPRYALYTVSFVDGVLTASINPVVANVVSSIHSESGEDDPSHGPLLPHLSLIDGDPVNLHIDLLPLPEPLTSL